MNNEIKSNKYNFKITGLNDTEHYFVEVKKSIENLEESFVNFIKSYFSNSSILALDVGANIGVTSLLMARLLGESSKIFSFEPGKNVFSCLKHNVDINNLNNNIFPINAAISDHDGLTSFFEDSAYGYISKDGDDLSTQMISINTFLIQEGIDKVDFIKIDVEGFEPEVFRGLEALKVKPIIYFELNTWTLIAYGRHNPVEFLEYLL